MKAGESDSDEVKVWETETGLDTGRSVVATGAGYPAEDVAACRSAAQDYQAFVAALLQRANRHQEAVTHYRTALQQSPSSGVWLMGLGISLQALHLKEEARDAFNRALESRTLNAELQMFVKQRLNEL